MRFGSALTCGHLISLLTLSCASAGPPRVLSDADRQGRSARSTRRLSAPGCPPFPWRSCVFDAHAVLLPPGTPVKGLAAIRGYCGLTDGPRPCTATSELVSDGGLLPMWATVVPRRRAAPRPVQTGMNRRPTWRTATMAPWARPLRRGTSGRHRSDGSVAYSSNRARVRTAGVISVPSAMLRGDRPPSHIRTIA